MVRKWRFSSVQFACTLLNVKIKMHQTRERNSFKKSFSQLISDNTIYSNASFTCSICLVYILTNWVLASTSIPLGILLIWILNVIRISALIALFEHYPNNFDLFHELSKYVFYFVIFMFWVFWEEKIRK
jgi:exosortase/archaeosortase family protein